MKSKLYKCKICLHQYREKKLAQKCHAWCNTHKSCSLEIIKQAVNLKKWHKPLGIEKLKNLKGYE